MIPTAFDRHCARGLASCPVHPVGARDWNLEPHTSELEAYADRMIELYDEVAPNFKASILHRDIIAPYPMDQEYGLIGGNIFHGELSLEQLFHMRPAPGYADYRTPIPACTTAARRRTRVVASAASPAGRRHARRWPTEGRQVVERSACGRVGIDGDARGHDD